MKQRTWLGCIVVLLSLPVGVAAAEPYADIESGVAFSGYNDVRIPRDTGTEFSLTDDLASDRVPFFRIRVGLAMGRHDVSLLAAPLRIDASGVPEEAIDYQNVRFPAGSRVDARYRFDSYRLSYLYRVKETKSWKVGVGVTGKIRDAEIRLESEERDASKKDTGFVPLLGVRVEWLPTSSFGLLLEGDALASPGGQGRAEDLFVGGTYRPTGRLELRAGYRILEGGADVDTVYNFALVHYVSLGVRVLLG